MLGVAYMFMYRNTEGVHGQRKFGNPWRNAVPHYITRDHGDLLNFGFQKSSDSSNQLSRFAFVNRFVNGGVSGYML